MSKRDALPDAEPVITDFTQGLVKDLLGACDQSPTYSSRCVRWSSPSLGSVGSATSLRQRKMISMR